MHSTKNVFEEAEAEVSNLGLTQAAAQPRRVLARGTGADTAEETSFQLTSPQTSPWPHVSLCVLERGP